MKKNKEKKPEKKTLAMKMIDKYDVEYHNIDFCPNCGDELKCKMISVKDLNRILIGELK